MSAISILRHLSIINPALVPVMLDAAVKGAAILALALVATACMRRASAAARHLVLFLGAASLLILPVLSSALPGWHVLPRWAAHDAASIHQTAAPTAVFTSAAPQPAPMMQPVSAPTDASPAPAAMAPSAAGDTWQAWVLLAWLAGTASVLGYVILGFASLWWLEHRSARIIDGDLPLLLRQACAQLSLSRPIRLLCSPRRKMPMIWGLWRPRVLLPQDCADWTPQQVRAVLLHELAHARRWDCLTQLAVQIACALYWFNPLTWLAWHRIQIEREQACDDLVIRGGTRASAYAEQILHFASEMPVACLGQQAIAMARRGTLEGRLLAILDERRNRRTIGWRSGLPVVFLAGALAIPLAMLHAQNAPPEPAPDPAWIPPPPLPAGFGVTIDAQGRPIAQASLKSADTPWSAESDAAGLFKLPPLVGPDFMADLTITAPGFAKREHALLGRNGKGEVEGHVIQLHRSGRLEGRILGPDGRPLAAAPLAVHLFDIYPDSAGNDSNAARGISDRDGHFVIENVPPGQLLLCYPWVCPTTEEIQYGRWNAWTRPGQPSPLPPTRGIAAALKLEMKDGQSLSGLTLDLSKSVAILEGRVVDGYGKPLPGAEVLLYWRADGGNDILTSPYGIPAVKTDGQGRYRLEKLPLGSWEVGASMAAQAWATPVPVELSSTPCQAPDLLIHVPPAAQTTTQPAGTGQ